MLETIDAKLAVRKMHDDMADKGEDVSIAPNSAAAWKQGREETENEVKTPLKAKVDVGVDWEEYEDIGDDWWGVVDPPKYDRDFIAKCIFTIVSVIFMGAIMGLGASSIGKSSSSTSASSSLLQVLVGGNLGHGLPLPAYS